MKKLLIVFVLFLAYGCSKEASTSVDNIASLEQVLGVTVSTSPIDRGLFFENVSYGNGSRQQLDLLLPGNQPLSGILLFFHGGAFISGDKASVFDDALVETIQTILDADIAVVSANYRFLDSPDAMGVLSAMEDGAAVISFIEGLASDLQLPSNKIILAGGSAGAGIAQWNAFRESTNSQVQGVIALEAQSSYNLYEWETVFPGFSLDATRQEYPILDQLFFQFYGGIPTDELLGILDYRAAIDANDPPLYLLNQQGGQEVFNAQGDLDIDVLFHSFRHADYLRLKAIQEGLEFSGAYQEAPEAFIVRMLR